MSLRQAILGFLSVPPMSGYDLRKAFAASVGHFWTADQAQIYRTLARLMADGRRELEAWLAAPDEAQPTREPFLLKLFFAGRLGPEPVRRILTHRLDAAEQQLAVLQVIAAEIEQAYAGRSIEL